MKLIIKNELRVLESSKSRGDISVPPIVYKKCWKTISPFFKKKLVYQNKIALEIFFHVENRNN